MPSGSGPVLPGRAGDRDPGQVEATVQASHPGSLKGVGPAGVIVVGWHHVGGPAYEGS